MLDIAATSLPEPKRGNFLSRREGHRTQTHSDTVTHRVSFHFEPKFGAIYICTNHSGGVGPQASPLRGLLVFAAVQVVLEFGAVRGAS